MAQVVFMEDRIQGIANLEVSIYLLRREERRLPQPAESPNRALHRWDRLQPALCVSFEARILNFETYD